ncbi:hypothetical protein ACWD04_10165 [Streptomyces sp. NPDC002911]
MSDPIPPAEWEEHFGPGPRHAPEDTVPSRPEVVEVTPDDVPETEEHGTAGHRGSGPAEGPPPPPHLPPAEPRRPLWRRPPGQQDDKGEPTQG